MTAPAARRYLAGWAGERELHLLAPRLLVQRASNVEGSLELLMLTPAALLARRYVAANHKGMPPPLGPRRLARWVRWAWLLEGAAQYFSGQVAARAPRRAAADARGAASRRSRRARADAPLLGGSVFACCGPEEGERACVALACGPHRHGPRRALEARLRGALPAPYGGRLALCTWSCSGSRARGGGAAADERARPRTASSRRATAP